MSLSGCSTVRQALQLVKAQTLAAQEHQDLPFEQVVEISGQPRTMAHSPVFHVMFAWENNEVTELNLPDLTLLLAPLQTPRRRPLSRCSIYYCFLPKRATALSAG